MTWTKLSDDFTDDPRLENLSRGIILMHVEAYIHCNRHRTDGYVSASGLRRMTSQRNPASAAAALVAAGVWVEVAGGWQIPDFSKTQISAADLEKTTDRTNARSRRHRLHSGGVHIECDSRHCRARQEELKAAAAEALTGGNAESNGVAHGVAHGVGHGALSCPVLPCPEGTKGREGKEGGSGSTSNSADAPFRPNQPPEQHSMPIDVPAGWPKA